MTLAESYTLRPGELVQAARSVRFTQGTILKGDRFRVVRNDTARGEDIRLNGASVGVWFYFYPHWPPYTCTLEDQLEEPLHWYQMFERAPEERAEP